MMLPSRAALPGCSKKSGAAQAKSVSPATAQAYTGPNAAQTRWLASEPSGAMSKAVIRLPKVSSTSSTLSSVMTVRWGTGGRWPVAC
jgi:hypothetical protein